MFAGVAALVMTLGGIAYGAGLPPGGSFLDDDGSVHEGFIEAIAAAGITRGCNPPANDQFCPDDTLTRGQMAAFLHRALPDLPVVVDDVDLKDVAASVFAGDISWLAAVGVSRGCNPPANDLFCPDDTVTRGQMAAFLKRALGLPGGGVTFTDTRGHTFEADIAALATAGITKGCNPPENTRFCPDDPVSREQMASFLARSLGLEALNPAPRATTTTTTTLPSTTTTTEIIPPNPGDSKNCSDFKTQAEAQAWFDKYYPYYGDIARLDQDNDGIACEGLP
ncbi:MAG TPA: S-layer homology domain-containing protein [Acidimicrobiia bacterium]|nr:S-layer homology domain-containing protein [Acidimicrobiia bacterium]